MLVLCAALAPGIPRTTTIVPGVEMPRMSLGTCCGSEPSIGLGPWLAAGGVGIDTAFDYGDQRSIAAGLAGVPRDSVFITTKVPAGLGLFSGSATLDCSLDPNRSLAVLRQDLAQLEVDHVDLVLLHAPCELCSECTVDPAAANAAQWAGLQTALKLGLTRAIGVSNYNVSHLKALSAAPTTTVAPAVNQCQMSINGSQFCLPNGRCLHGRGHDDEALAYCLAHGITYEAYNVMNGCPFHDPRAAKIAAARNMSVAQVCFRWVLQHGAIMATGTGNYLQ